LDKISEKEVFTKCKIPMKSYSICKGFIQNLKKVLPDKDCKAVSEEDFNRKLLHQYRDRGHENNILFYFKI
jgi:hypothetical protein